MPIVHVNLAAGLRGGERQTLLLMAALADRGWQQRLVTRPDAALANALTPADRLTLSVREASDVFAAARESKDATLVHAHDGRAVYAAALAGWRYRRPYVITRRVMNPIRRRWTARYAYRNAAAVVAISSAVANEIRRFDPALEPQRIPSAYQPEPLVTGAHEVLRARWQGKFVVGNVAALENDSKGQLTLIRVARELRDVHVVLVGSGRDEAMLREAASDLDNVEFAGQVDDVDAYLRAFDLFAFPSLREGFGSTLLDAMRLGLAVVAKRTGGIVDIVDDDVTGYLVNRDDDEGFVAAVRLLQRNATKREKFGAAARKRVEQFSPAIMGDAYDALYRHILKWPENSRDRIA